MTDKRFEQAEAVFPLPAEDSEAVRGNLEHGAGRNKEGEQKEFAVKRTLEIKGSDVDHFLRQKSIGLEKETAKLNGVGGVSIEMSGNAHILTYTTFSGDRIQTFVSPEQYLSNNAGYNCWTETQREQFSAQWNQLPEEFRTAYLRYVDWAYGDSRTGIDLDILEQMNARSDNPFALKEIRDLSKNPNKVVLGTVRVQWGPTPSMKFYWATVDKD